MNQLTSKFSLYDIVSMILPGGVIIWTLIMAFPSIKTSFIPMIGIHGDVWLVLAFVAAAYVVGLIFNIMMGYVWRPLVNNRMLLKWVRDKKKKRGYKHIGTEKEDFEQKYRLAYEYVNQNCVNNPIPVVESQISMLRNLILPLTFWIIALPFQCLCNCSCEDECTCARFILVTIGILCGFLLLIFTILRQMRLYNIVLAHYEYLKQME